ncbi:MAG: pyruvate, phosphate dikinase, partial [Anaerolineae bacterium]
MTKKWVYLSRSAKDEVTETLGYEPEMAEMKEILGGKGAGLATMTAANIPVPPAFTITTEACVDYMETGELPPGMWEQTLEALEDIEEQTGKGFGDPENPLLVSVRSGARVSMPGMMDTVLNLGLNEETLEALARLTDNERFAYDAYRRFLTMFSDIVMGVHRLHFEEMLRELKKREGVEKDTDVSLEGLKELAEKYKAFYREQIGEPFPTDPLEQLRLSIKAVFDSWNGARAVAYREYNDIPHDWGTGVNVQTMVFGNMGEGSGTGVAFTRNPATGDKRLFGDFLENAQGEDVVAGIRTPLDIQRLQDVMPEIYDQFIEVTQHLEQFYRDMQDVEFTVERGKLWMLQTRDGKRTAKAAVKIAVDMVHEALIDKETALMRVPPGAVDQLLHPFFDPDAKISARDEGKLIAEGLNASPGAATGWAVFSAKRAREWAEEGKAVILVRPETVPDEVPGMLASKGVLTQHGGATSHAAVVARGSNLPAVVGCEDIRIDVEKAQFTVPATGRIVKEGDIISIDGASGEVFAGQIPTVEVEYEEQDDLVELLSWADDVRELGVRTNADYGEDAAQARAFGAEGIGLCRTEHMFFDERARDAVVRMILAESDEERQAALDEMLPIQEQDFEQVFEAMDGLPVIMRLIDPPMHEFLPPREELIADVERLRCVQPDSPELEEKKAMLEVVNALWEVNPMMGLR